MTSNSAARRMASALSISKSKDDLIAIYSQARAIAYAGQTPPTPKALRSAWAFAPGGLTAATFNAQQVSMAEAVLDLMIEFGNRGGRHAADDITDRRVLDALADQFNWDQDERISDTAAGKKVGLSHTTIGTRRKEWCARVLSKLQTEWPALFGQPYAAHIAEAKSCGAKSLTDIAAYLTGRQIPTPNGARQQWHAKQVARLAA